MAKKKRVWNAWCIMCRGVGPIWPTFAETRREAIEKFGSDLKKLSLYFPAKIVVRQAPIDTTVNRG